MKHSYVIIDDDPDSVLKTKAIADGFQNLKFIGSADSYNSGLDLILEYTPKIVFMEIDPSDQGSNLSLSLVNELYRYLKEVPTIIITTKSKELAFEAIKYEIFDYFIKPIEFSTFRKAIFKFEKTNSKAIKPVTTDNVMDQQVNLEGISAFTMISDTIEDHEPDFVMIPQTENAGEVEIDQKAAEEDEMHFPVVKREEKPLIICVKSYGDYRFIEAKDICYLQADNNSTDIHLYNGEMITAFKTLKHFEGVLSSPFVRIHNSYIVNIDYVSRIHTGNSVCYIKNTTTKLPFSKSYKENVDSIINSITNGNYLEI